MRKEPEVARWWNELEPNEVEEDFIDSDTVLVIESDGEVAGIVQFYEEEDPDYRHASIDISLATKWHGRGIGPEALRVLAQFLFDERGHHRLTIDPAAANERAIKAYEKVGFKRVGVMRDYERGRDGSWHDGVLMDLLKGELLPSPES